MQRGLAIALTAFALGGGVGGGEAPGVGAPAPRSDADLRVGVPAAVLPARARSWRGGVLTSSTGEQVRVEVSDAYPPEAVSAQAWADFFAGLVHGRELASVTVRVGSPLDVLVECGGEALACYDAGVLVLPGELWGGITPEELARHEYGHHVAANRLNAPWPAADWGPKRWASQVGVCARAAAGTASPTSNTDYERHPGEAFAEVYRVLNERRGGSAALTWSIVDDGFIPDAAALRAAEEDITRPWLAPVKQAVAGRFERGLQRRLIHMPTPLDGLWAGASTRKLAFTVCGHRRLTLRVTGTRTPGPYQVAVTRP